MKWTECPVSSPCPGVLPLSRSSHGVSIIGDRLFMFGGEHEARTPVGSEVWALDLKTDGGMEWRALKAQGEPPSPRSVITYHNQSVHSQFILPRFGHGQCAVGSDVYIFGGRQGTAIDEKLLNDVHKFDTRTCTWSRVPVSGGGYVVIK